MERDAGRRGGSARTQRAASCGGGGMDTQGKHGVERGCTVECARLSDVSEGRGRTRETVHSVSELHTCVDRGVPDTTSTTVVTCVCAFLVFYIMRSAQCVCRVLQTAGTSSGDCAA